MVQQAQVTRTEADQLKRFFEQTRSLPRLLTTVRSRRVGLGYSIEPGEEQTHPVTGQRLFQEKGPLAFVSSKQPVPLTEVEEALIAWAACGPNGTINWDIAVHGGYHELSWLAGRTVPAPGNSLATDLLIINDKGCHIYKPGKERSGPLEIRGEQDYHKVLDWYRESLVTISDQRPDVSWGSKLDAAPHASIFGPYQYNLNKPGSTWFIPLQDLGWLMFSVMPNLFDWWHLLFVDDQTGQPAGLGPWAKEGQCEMPVTISQFEMFLYQVETYVPGCMVQNIRLACEALGLGTWVFCGYFDDVLMGAMPVIAKGLGFQAEELNTRIPWGSGQLKIFGVPGVKESSYVPSPRWKNGQECLAEMMQEKYGPGGALCEDEANNWMLKTGAPYKPEVARQIIHHPRNKIPQWAVDAAAAYVDYCVDKYGQCPVFINPMQCNFGAVVHHVDEAFYQQYYSDGGSMTDELRKHMQSWH